MEIIAITIPIFIFVIIGYILKYKGIITPEIKDFLSKLVYYFAFPAMTFRSIVSFDFASTFRLKLVAHNLMMTSLVFVFTFFAAFLIRDRRKRGSFNMSCFRSNQGYMGLPIVNGFYGEEAMSRAAVINGFDSPMVILYSVFALEVFRGSGKNASGNGGSKKAVNVIADKLLSFITNPFIISSVLGLILSYFKVPVLNVRVIDEFLKSAGSLALPLALISIGCSIEVKDLKSNIRLVLGTSAIKLLLMPAVALLTGLYLFRFSGADLGVCVILTAMPSSVSSYIMAREMGADEELSANMIGVTTFISVITVSVIQFVLKTYYL
jgi:predicted permease